MSTEIGFRGFFTKPDLNNMESVNDNDSDAPRLFVDNK